MHFPARRFPSRRDMTYRFLRTSWLIEKYKDYLLIYKLLALYFPSLSTYGMWQKRNWAKVWICEWCKCVPWLDHTESLSCYRSDCLFWRSDLLFVHGIMYIHPDVWPTGIGTATLLLPCWSRATISIKRGADGAEVASRGSPVSILLWFNALRD